MDKFVFGVEWNVLPLYGHSSSALAVTKLRFGGIFIETPDKADMSANSTSWYRATGVYPINPTVIPDANFAPSLLTHSEDTQVYKVVTATETPTAAFLSQQKDRKGFLFSWFIWQRCVNQQEW